MNSLTFRQNGCTIVSVEGKLMSDFVARHNRILFGGKAPASRNACKRAHQLPSTSTDPGSRRFAAFCVRETVT